MAGVEQGGCKCIHIYCNFLIGSVATSPASQLSLTELIQMQNDLFNKREKQATVTNSPELRRLK